MDRTTAASIVGTQLVNKVDEIHPDCMKRSYAGDDVTLCKAEVDAGHGVTLAAYYYQATHDLNHCTDIEALLWFVDRYELES